MLQIGIGWCGASDETSTFIHLEPLVAVRTHSDQLSYSNQQSGAPLAEAVLVIKTLQKDFIVNQPLYIMWCSASLMQHHLWNQVIRGLGLIILTNLKIN